MDRSRIRVKAFGVIVDAARARHVVSRMSTTENPTFHRSLGGSIELGETSLSALRREFHEELGTELVDPVLIDVIENIFTIDGELGHEIAFIYVAQLPDDAIVPVTGRAFTDVNKSCWAEWRPLSGDPDVPLFPDGLQDAINRWLASAPELNR